MPTYWRKTARDLWMEPTRTVIAVLAIALGIAASQAVLSAYAIITRELNAGYLATNPASATLRTDVVDAALVAEIREHPGVRDAEPRRTISGRIKVGAAEWRNLVLFVVQDFGDVRISRLKPQSGAWPPAAGEILIERDAFQVARTRVGASVTVKLPRGIQQLLRVSGSVHDVGQAQARMENLVYGYITLDTLAQLGEEPYLDQVSILVSGDQFDQQHVRSVAAEIRGLVEQRGHRVSRLDVPVPGKHPHADIMGLLLLTMSIFGFAVLALAGILVVNLLTALMASQVRQVGVMQAIGGSRGQIARIYLGQASAMGLAAVLVAYPAGVFGGRALCTYLAVFLNFDIVSFSVPAWVYLAMAVVGVLVPLLAAAHPVWKGCGVQVREALADFGVSLGTSAGDAFGGGRMDRMMVAWSGPFRPLAMAARNALRRRTRLALTLLTLASGGLFFMSALNIRGSMILTLDRLFETRRYDLSATLGSMYPTEQIQRAVAKMPGAVRAEGWIVTQGWIPLDAAAQTPGQTGGLHAGSGEGMHGGGAAAGERFTVMGVPPQSRCLKLEMIEGRDLAPGDTNDIVMNAALAAKTASVKVGDTVQLRMGPSQMPWRVVGIARESFSPATGYVPLAMFEKLGGHVGVANSIRLVLDKDDAASIVAARASLDEHLEREGITALASSSKADSRFGFDQHMVMIYVFLIVMSGILAGVGGFGLATTMSLNVLERRREMGVLRAIGATPRDVWLVIVTEGVAIGVLSWVVAGLVAWPLSKGLGNLLASTVFRSALDFRFEWWGLLAWLLVVTVLGVSASLLPAWRASRLTVREALSYE